jgi:peptidyl-prolyl cis-trans isomerase B (cyclophilin B)
MVSNKQRRRQLARARWERQQARRRAAENRQRLIRLIAGVVGGLVVVAVLGWVVLRLVADERARNPSPTLPANTLTPSLSTPLPTPTVSATTGAETATTPGGSPGTSGSGTKPTRTKTVPTPDTSTPTSTSGTRR